MKIKQTSLFLITNILGITNYITLRFQLLNIFNIDSDNNIDNFLSILFVLDLYQYHRHKKFNFFI